MCYAISQVDASARRSDNLPVLSGMEMIRNAQRPLYVRGRRRHVSVVNETAEPQDGGIESPQTAFLFVPGAGGQAEQFFKQMTLFREGGPLSGHTAVLFSHSGHGPNTVEPYDWESLSFEELLEDVVEMYNLAVCILRKRFPPEKQSGEKEHTPRVLVVAHSYGCALSVCALSRMPLVSGVVLLAPPVKQPTSWPKWAILRLPSLAIDVIRVSDRTGGPDSPSVKRMLGEGGEGVEQEIARQQLGKSRLRNSCTHLSTVSTHRLPPEAHSISLSCTPCLTYSLVRFSLCLYLSLSLPPSFPLYLSLY